MSSLEFQISLKTLISELLKAVLGTVFSIVFHAHFIPLEKVFLFKR